MSPVSPLAIKEKERVKETPLGSGRVTTAVEGEKLGELVLEGPLISENSRLVSKDGTHVSAEGLHILGNEDSMLLVLVLESIEAVSKGEHRVL